MQRRNFLRNSLLTAAAISAARPLFAQSAKPPYLSDLGIQLYTLRNEIAKDVNTTIKTVAAAGYKQVEMYGFPNCDAMVKAVRDSGLALNSSHFEWDSVVNPKDDSYSDFSKILDKAKEIGLKHLVIPYLADSNRKTLDDYKKVAAHANKSAALAKSAGIQLSYHNHNFEFEPKENGISGFDVFVKEFSADMKFELDVFWVKAAGIDPVELVNKLNGRVSQLHLKDLKKDIPIPTYAGLPDDAFQEIGDGIIAMAPILAAAQKAGVEHCHVEQDQSPDALASIKQSIDFLRKLS
jgi:sugar phosphate isomerase/epimerase